MPQAAEYPKETILTFEKEVLGIYLSGHPLERYRNMMEKMISAKLLIFSRMMKQGYRRFTITRK